MGFLKNKRKLVLLLLDLLVFCAVYCFSLLLQFVSSGGLKITIANYILNFLILVFFVFAIRFAVHTYSNVWRYANSMVFLKVVLSDFIGGAFAAVVTFFIKDVFIGVWETISVIALFDVATLITRFFYQEKHKRRNSDVHKNKVTNKIGVAIVGAGYIGTLLAEELMYNHASHYYPVCFIDKDKNKIDSVLLGLRVLGDDDSVIMKLRELPVQEIFIALPEISNARAKTLLDFYGKTGCKVKLYDLPLTDEGYDRSGKKRVIREVRIEDLLFRDSLKVVNSATRDFYLGKTVLVTGGGGSIGSEICRQIAHCEPKKLIIVDIYENNAYDIQQELKRTYGDKLDLSVEIASVRDEKRLDAIFNAYRPDVVFHAAAHKHVPLMEHSNCEAIKNNVLGTYNTANVAEKYGVERFILISTDKAVNPTNVMGASKRLCEMIVQSRFDSKTSFAAVRFGNVLGSNGSVIPLFQRQIDAGGPVTVTDKRIIRYFMTIPEASGLVMQAGSMAKGGDLFVLDMGNPVKIIDLAENMIKLSGYIPYRDIDIVETGLRPGEKLYEELLIKTEKLDKTSNNMIFIERDTPNSRERVDEIINILMTAVKDAENEIGSESIKTAIMSVVPTFRPPEEVNRKAYKSEEMKLVSLK